MRYADTNDRKIRVYFYVEANPGCKMHDAALAGWPDATRENRTVRVRAYARIRYMVRIGVIQSAGGRLYPRDAPPF